MKTAVVTISSRVPGEPYYFYHAFVRSCQKQGIDPIWLPATEWRGLISKPKLLLAFLEKHGAEYDIITFCDAWDIVWVGPLQEAVEKFLTFARPLVFNAERNCFPRQDLAERFPMRVTPYRFLNSGFFIGRTEAVIQCLRDLHLDQCPDDHRRPNGTNYDSNDQDNLQAWYVDHLDRADLDGLGTICQTLHGAEPDEFYWNEEMRRPVSKLTGSIPAVFHGNGGGKDWLKKIIQWAGL